MTTNDHWWSLGFVQFGGAKCKAATSARKKAEVEQNDLNWQWCNKNFPNNVSNIDSNLLITECYKLLITTCYNWVWKGPAHRLLVTAVRNCMGIIHWAAIWLFTIVHDHIGQCMGSSAMSGPHLCPVSRVLKSSWVWSFCYFLGNCNWDQSFLFGNFIRLDQDHKRPVAHGLLQLSTGSGCQLVVTTSVTTQYGLPHYAYMTRWTCSFSFYLPCSSLTLCSIHMDNLVPLYDTTPLPLCPCLCSTYDAVLILSIAMSLFINTYASLYLQVYIPWTL